MAFFKLSKSHRAAPQAPDPMTEALDRALAVIWFSPGGDVLEANAKFCALMGYEPAEILGRNHEMFVPRESARSPQYQAFWARLRAGEPVSEIFARLAKGGRPVWIEASYVPLRGASGAVEKVVNLATDVTRRIEAAAEARGRLDALDRSQAVIEFGLDGTIVSANENFLAAVGYGIDELRGKPHGLFVDQAERDAPAYKAFWAELAAGKPQSGEFRRFGKGGREIWLQATYNPILGPDGRPVKVVKFASDITAEKNRALDQASQLAALDLSQAVIEFRPDGTIIGANDNFLAALGYARDEIHGKHHSLFVPPDEAASADYKAFWQALRRGEYQSAAYLRLGKGGREVWIQATYNPITSADGQVYKVVKFATDITASKQAMLAFQDAMTRLAENDLGVRIEVAVPPEFEVLKSQFNGSMEALSTVVAEIAERADTMLAEVAQIAEAAGELSQRTERQAAALEQTATALDELTASVHNAAEGAGEAVATSNAAKLSTETGLATVQKAVEAMDRIATGSQQVQKITGLIDDIAFQTNLLALNAGVEAARAGESGRGFAVVASEVRQLAQRSSEAAREIAELIQSTTDQIQHGVTLVDESGHALGKIAANVEDIRSRVAMLASGAREQSVGLDEINTAMNQLDQVTQQNAAMFEETSAANTALEREAKALSASTGAFGFGQGESDDATGWDEAARRRA